MTYELSDFNGAKVRRLREEKEYSQAMLSQRSGVSDVYISQLENDSYIPSLRVCKKLADALRVDVAELFGPEPEELVDVEYYTSLFARIKAMGM